MAKRVSVLKVNLDAIKNNIARIRKLLNHNQKLCMVVKANAYGFGAKKLCEYASPLVDYFAVSSASEFFEIKTKTIKPILILDPIFSDVSRLIRAGAELTVSNFESLEIIQNKAQKLNIKAKVHIALNTGMNRFGFKSLSDIKKVIELIEKSQNIIILGVFSHLFMANNKNFAKNQISRFNYFKQFFDNHFSNLTYHISASDGVVFGDKFDMVRAGMMVYNDDFYDTISLESKVLEIQNLNKNETAGYSACFKANRRTKLAVIGIGYGDGLHRNIAENGYVLINKNKAKIVAICMDCMIVDVTDFDVKINDKVIIIGSDGKNKISICNVASWCDTIGYEIIVHLLPRVKREYIEKEKCYANYNRKIQGKKTSIS